MQKTLFAIPAKPQAKPVKPEPKPIKKMGHVASLQGYRQQYDIFTADELPIVELIQRRRRQLIVHSCLYYELNANLISDAQFDEWGKELAMLQAKYPSISKNVVFADAFEGWDGSTGYHLPYHEDWVIRKAQQLLSYERSGGVGKHKVGK